MAGTPLWSEELTMAALILYAWRFSLRCSSTPDVRCTGGSSACITAIGVVNKKGNGTQAAAPRRHGRRDWTRTNDLLAMNQTSYFCSTLLYRWGIFTPAVCRSGIWHYVDRTHSIQQPCHSKLERRRKIPDICPGIICKVITLDILYTTLPLVCQVLYLDSYIILKPSTLNADTPPLFPYPPIRIYYYY